MLCLMHTIHCTAVVTPSMLRIAWAPQCAQCVLFYIMPPYSADEGVVTATE